MSAELPDSEGQGSTKHAEERKHELRNARMVQLRNTRKDAKTAAARQWVGSVGCGQFTLSYISRLSQLEKRSWERQGDYEMRERTRRLRLRDRGLCLDLNPFAYSAAFVVQECCRYWRLE